MKNVFPINGNVGLCRADGHQTASRAIGNVGERGVQCATTTASDEILEYLKECDRDEQRSFLIGFVSLLLEAVGPVSITSEAAQ